jgi:hypothetical protein
MIRLPQALAGLNLSSSGGRQASSSALLGKWVGAGEELARAPLERETGDINEAAAGLGAFDEAVNCLGNIEVGRQQPYASTRFSP